MSLIDSTENSFYRHMRSKILLGLGLLLVALQASGQALPDGPGKAATIRVCGKCHSPERATLLHQRRSAWRDTVVKMVKLGAVGSDEELEAIVDYLSAHYGVEVPGPIDINTARAVDLEAGLLLRRSQAVALVAYREKNGPFKSMDELRNVPGLDIATLESKKSRIVF